MEKSHQYQFLNNLNGFSLSIIKGERLISQISDIHNIGPHAKDFYNKTVSSSMQMVNFLKSTESLGFYIDSESPYYRFKVEMGSEGTMRTLLLPEEFSEFPTTFTGKCRIHKTILGKSPYTSVLEFEDEPLEELINKVMVQSYQTKSQIVMGKNNESSVMITLLPPTNIDKKIDELDPFSIEKVKENFGDLIEKALNTQSEEEILSLFPKDDFTYLGSKQLKFHCPCSKERMIENLFTLSEDDREHIFEEQNPVEVRCDYCNTNYAISKDEVSPIKH